MTKEQAIRKIHEFEKKAARDFEVSADMESFKAASAKVKRNLDGFGITAEEYAAYTSKVDSKPPPRGFFTDRPPLPKLSDLDAMIDNKAKEISASRSGPHPI